MDSIRILNEDTRLYIVFDNPSAEAKQAAMDFVSKRIGAKAKEETPTGVYPPKVLPYQVPENLEEVKIENTEEKPKENVKIPYISSPEIFVEWYLKYDSLDARNQSILLTRCKYFMSAHLKKVHRSNISEIKTFLLDFEPIFGNTINDILKKNGYNNLKAFLNTEGEANIQAAYDVCKNGICNTLKIK